MDCSRPPGTLLKTSTDTFDTCVFRRSTAAVEGRRYSFTTPLTHLRLWLAS